MKSTRKYILVFFRVFSCLLFGGLFGTFDVSNYFTFDLHLQFRPTLARFLHGVPVAHQLGQTLWQFFTCFFDVVEPMVPHGHRFVWRFRIHNLICIFLWFLIIIHNHFNLTPPCWVYWSESVGSGHWKPGQSSPLWRMVGKWLYLRWAGELALWQPRWQGRPVD